MKQLSQEEIKNAIGKKAASLVEDGMLIGLGTGSTTKCFIASLIERCRLGLKITVAASSFQTLMQAQSGGIPTIAFDQFTTLDLTIDGADEIDPQNRMIKGGGGALVREKILATSSHQMIVILDESKVVDVLGKCPLPIEIIPFGYKATLAKIRQMGYEGDMRITNDGSFYSTDNKNYIFDIHSPKHYPHPEKDHQSLISLTGVVDTGFFFNLPLRVLIGYGDGSVLFREDKT